MLIQCTLIANSTEDTTNRGAVGKLCVSKKARGYGETDINVERNRKRQKKQQQSMHGHLLTPKPPIKKRARKIRHQVSKGGGEKEKEK
jgi:hypothetical protein